MSAVLPVKPFADRREQATGNSIGWKVLVSAAIACLGGARLHTEARVLTRNRRTPGLRAIGGDECYPYQGKYAWAPEIEVSVSSKSLMALVRLFDLIGAAHDKKLSCKFTD